MIFSGINHGTGTYLFTFATEINSPYYIEYPVFTEIKLLVGEILLTFATLDAVAVLADTVSLHTTGRATTSLLPTVSAVATLLTELEHTAPILHRLQDLVALLASIADAIGTVATLDAELGSITAVRVSVFVLLFFTPTIASLLFCGGYAGVVVAVALVSVLTAFTTAVSAIIALLLTTREIFAVGLTFDNSELIEAVAGETCIITPHFLERLLYALGNIVEVRFEVIPLEINHILQHRSNSIDLGGHSLLNNIRLSIHLNSSFDWIGLD